MTVLNREVVDFQASTSFDTGFGLWSADFNWSHYLNYDAEESYGTGDLYNAAGVLGLPDNRMSFLLRWELGDSWFSSLNVDYIGESNSRISDAYWDSWTTANMTVGYATDNFGTFTVGATNLTDEDPPLDDIGQPKEQDGYLYGWTGRVWFARYSIEF